MFQSSKSSAIAPIALLALGACRSPEFPQEDLGNLPAHDAEGAQERSDRIRLENPVELQEMASRIQSVSGIAEPLIFDRFSSGQYLVVDAKDESLHFVNLDVRLCGRLLTVEEEPLLKNQQYIWIAPVAAPGSDNYSDSMFGIVIGDNRHTPPWFQDVAIYTAESVDGKINLLKNVYHNGE